MRSFYVNRDNFISTKIGVCLNIKMFLKDRTILHEGKEYRELYIICQDYFNPMGINKEYLCHINVATLFFQGSLLLTKATEKILFSITKEIEDFYA